MSTVKFHLGDVVVTPGAFDALKEAGQSIHGLLLRHACGDWGDVPPEDAAANEAALASGARLLSAYTLADGVKVWIVTDAVGDTGRREATSLLLPEEY